MGLKADFNNNVKAIFDKFADLMVGVTYTQKTSTARIPGGEVSHTTVDYPISVLISNYTVAERGGGSANKSGYESENIRNEDMKLLMPIKGMTFTIDSDGTFTLPTGDIAVVISVKVDPSESLYIVQVRK